MLYPTVDPNFGGNAAGQDYRIMSNIVLVEN
jgi:hypothetical protein